VNGNGNGPTDRPPAVLRARFVVPVSSPAIEDGAVEMEGGRIVAVGKAGDVMRQAASGARVHDFGDAAILPGFVNAHSHLELTALRGLLEGLEFPEWIRRLSHLKYTVLTPRELGLSARWGVLEGLRSGITCWGDTSDSGAAVEAILAEGARGIVYQEVFGPHPDDCEKALHDLASKVTDLRRQVVSFGRAVSRGDLFDLPPGPLEMEGARVEIGISPHAPYTVSQRLFKACAALALEEGLPVAVHLAESADEELLLKDGTGWYGRRFAERGIPFDAPKASPFAYIEELGLLKTKPLLIHCVRTTWEELLRAKKAGATVAHCPQSNAKLGHGVAPLSLMLDAGLSVGLGTDGVVSNNAHDPFNEMKFCALIHRAAGKDPKLMPATTVLELATLGAARALGLDGRVGSLEPGKFADFAVVSLAAASLKPVQSVETALVFSASARDVTAVFLAGRRLYPDLNPLREAYAELGRKLGAAQKELAAA